MTPQPASMAVVEQYARQLVDRPGAARILALEAAPDWAGPQRLNVEGAVVQVRGCPSALAVREALSELGSDEYLVVLTDRSQSDLGESLTSQFHHSRIHAVDPWGAVAQMFAAPGVAADLRGLGLDVAGAIGSHRPSGAYPPMPAGAVTADHAARSLLAAVLNTSAAPDTSSLLRASMDPAAKKAWQSLPPAAREALHRWARDGIGIIAPTILNVLDSSSPLDAVTIGLAADVLWSPAGGVDAVRAQGRLEVYTAGRALDTAAARGLSQAAKAYVAGMAVGDPNRAALLQRAEVLLADVQWEQGAEHSDILEAGFHARVRNVATAVEAAMGGASSAAAETALTVLSQHRIAREQPAMVRQPEMAVRLLRWLRSDDAEPRTLSQALRRQIDVDGWVDWATSDVWAGSADPVVAAAYGRLAEEVQQRRRLHDNQFGVLLAQSATDVLGEDLTGVESLLPRIAAPIVQSSRSLLIVVDGMSVAVACELAGDVAGRGWVEMVRGSSRTPVVAALPTLTRYSRTSLFSGSLTDGGQTDEKRALASLIPGTKLFHKDDLRAAAGHALPHAVREAAASEAPLVAAVLNTVDDALAKADPDGTHWNLSTIQHLAALLDLAATTDRTVIIASDHGHVVERGSRRIDAAEAEARFRPVVGEPRDGEVLLEGARVLSGPVIAAVQEDLRYGNKAAGYHGGASAAEVTIPLLVFTRAPERLASAGWVPAPPQEPEWWHVAAASVGSGDGVARPVQVSSVRPGRRSAAEPEGMEALFEADTSTPDEEAAGADGGVRVAAARERAEAVVASTAYRAHVGQPPGRGMPEASVTVEALTCLLTRGGRAHRDVLARAINVPGLRLRGALATLSRALNLDGYQVITLDPDEVTVVLDERLLDEQFPASGVGR